MAARNQRFLDIKGKRTVDSFHKELGKIMWEDCGMARNEAGLDQRPPADSRSARGVPPEPQRPRDRATR